MVSAKYCASVCSTHAVVVNYRVSNGIAERILLLAKSLQHAGIVKTELAQRLSVVLSLLAAFYFS